MKALRNENQSCSNKADIKHGDASSMDCLVTVIQILHFVNGH